MCKPFCSYPFIQLNITPYVITPCCGRYYDEKTNRIKTIGPPSRNINMTDWKTKMNYLIQHAAYKWNQYARA